ncbi:MAG: hypothetical protein II199_01800 [Bacteroidaceae bacterium]|nr:hypothetical protein [Bacteroidaceae bacterium]
MSTNNVSSTSATSTPTHFVGGHVLKFGGSSVGTPESIRCVKDIVEKCQYPVIVVVSELHQCIYKIATQHLLLKDAYLDI